ncbi:MAG: hypothetical protein WDO13_08365 [Verrucomicrobiota bacterium]
MRRRPLSPRHRDDDPGLPRRDGLAAEGHQAAGLAPARAAVFAGVSGHGLQQPHDRGENLPPVQAGPAQVGSDAAANFPEAAGENRQACEPRRVRGFDRAGRTLRRRQKAERRRRLRHRGLEARSQGKEGGFSLESLRRGRRFGLGARGLGGGDPGEIDFRE